MIRLLRQSMRFGSRDVVVSSSTTRQLHSETQSTSRPERTMFGKQEDAFHKVKSNQLKMSAWQIHDYGDLQELQYSDKVKMPQIQQANECLIKILSSSVNPIDVAMLSE